MAAKLAERLLSNLILCSKKAIDCVQLKKREERRKLES